MSKVAIQGNASGTGVLTIAAPNTNSDRVLNLPDNSGTLLSNASTFAGTGPAFSAYMSGNQTVTSGVLTKLTLNTEVFDTNSNFDNVTNYRFTPTVAGYYQINMALLMNGLTTAAVVAIYKNGSIYTNTVYYQAAGVTTQYPLAVLIYLNGSTDYVEFYGQTNGGTSLGGGATGTFANASLARAA